MLLAIPIGIGCALALAFGIPRKGCRPRLSTAVELLSGGAERCIRAMGTPRPCTVDPDEYIEPFLARLTGGHGPFSGAQIGTGLLLAGLILFIMVLPTMTAISRDVFLAVPKEADRGRVRHGARRGGRSCDEWWSRAPGRDS